MPQNQYKNLSLWGKLQQHLIRITDSEPEQAIKIRLPIALAVVLYFSLPWHHGETFIALIIMCICSIYCHFIIGRNRAIILL